MAHAVVFTTPDEAEAAFYEAFEHADLKAMMAVWVKDESAVCIHPGGSRIQGSQAIARSWKRLFANGARLNFTLTNTHRYQDSLTAVHLLKELIEVENVLQGVILTTNVYHLIEGSWRLRLHHASPEPPSHTTDGPKPILH